MCLLGLGGLLIRKFRRK
ncbi:MAG: hypothetical protein JW947_03720 [Sedimentisphaerales bacterium]|nr:hypothetical protein [Sedimentisphaerales bacterium]